MLGCLYFVNDSLSAQKPKVWIYTDMSDKTIAGKNHMGTLNDPDDISAMAGYLLMGNMFDTKGIVVASTHRGEHANTPDQEEWANTFWGDAYKVDVPYLNKNIGGFPEEIRFMQSCIKQSGERFDPSKSYASLEKYNTVRFLYNLVEQDGDIINVLCWGSLTEPAILVSHCLATGRTDLLQRLRFIGHWTSSSLHQGSMEHPENVANCREDAKACAYIKQKALDGCITYYECGAIGQHGIVSGSPKGDEYYNQFKVSELGKIFAEGKYVQNCVDHSDAATYWVLLQNWGVGLSDITSNGTNFTEVEQANEKKFSAWSTHIHSELLRRATLAAPSKK